MNNNMRFSMEIQRQIMIFNEISLTNTSFLIERTMVFICVVAGPDYGPLRGGPLKMITERGGVLVAQWDHFT